jgi:triosephosphate isomerase
MTDQYIFCVGESETEQENGKTEQVVAAQIDAVINKLGVAALKESVIAYEPVWAIGTGITANTDEIKGAHEYIRNFIVKKGYKNKNISIIYGGSVTSINAEEISKINSVDGFLVGGASLNVDSFYEIYNKLQES